MLSFSPNWLPLPLTFLFLRLVATYWRSIDPSGLDAGQGFSLLFFYGPVMLYLQCGIAVVADRFLAPRLAATGYKRVLLVLTLMAVVIALAYGLEVWRLQGYPHM